MSENISLNREILEASVGLGDEVTVNKLQFIERLHAIGVSKYIALPQVILAKLQEQLLKITDKNFCL